MGSKQRMPIVDPKLGDAADDASSTLRRSWFDLFGSLLLEISIARALFGILVSIVVPALILGVAPLAGSMVKMASEHWLGLDGSYSLAVLCLLGGVALLVWRSLREIVEASFWSLNATLIQPLYVLCRELFGYFADRWLLGGAKQAVRDRLRSWFQVGAGVSLGTGAFALAVCAWPESRWVLGRADFIAPSGLIGFALWNAVVLLAAYAAIAFVGWGIDDALMGNAQRSEVDDTSVDGGSPGGARWRVAHLSDLHVVGEQYGFRLETGRMGPRGNIRLRRALALLAESHKVEPLDFVLVSGDLTDAGRSAEWAELFDILEGYDELAKRMLVVPGNHDLNIIDRSNPARLEFPFSRGRGLREMRAMSALEQLQGDRVYVMDQTTRRFTQTLSQALVPHLKEIGTFSDAATLWASIRLGRLWREVFPMILPPDERNLGIILLNSNAVTGLSFTNALGMISGRQRCRISRAMREYPEARWIILLHHHLMEYFKPSLGLSERLGTALIDGTWFARRLSGGAGSVAVMHGHRHLDWQGRWRELSIVSAPSTVMERDESPSYFYIHTFGSEPGARLLIRGSQKIEVSSEGQSEGA